jgi:hypothetical protein
MGSAVMLPHIWLHEQDWRASVTVAMQYILINSLSVSTYQWKWDDLLIYTLMQWPFVVLQINENN